MEEIRAFIYFNSLNFRALGLREKKGARKGLIFATFAARKLKGARNSENPCLGKKTFDLLSALLYSNNEPPLSLR